MNKIVEIILIIMTCILFISMFLVEEMLGCLLFLMILINIIILGSSGTITNDFNNKLMRNKYK